MGLEVLVARDQQRPRWRYQRLHGEVGGGDGEEEEAAAATRVCRVRRQLRLRRSVGKAAAAASVAGRRSCSSSSKRAPLLFRMARAGGRGRKVRLMRLVFVMPARRVAALFAELVRRLASAIVDGAAAECPTIVFSSQWGLPVLSHSASSPAGARTARLRSFYLDRSLSSAGSGSGSGSPC